MTGPMSRILTKCNCRTYDHCIKGRNSVIVGTLCFNVWDISGRLLCIFFHICVILIVLDIFCYMCCINYQLLNYYCQGTSLSRYYHFGKYSGRHIKHSLYFICHEKLQPTRLKMVLAKLYYDLHVSVSGTMF